MSRTYVVQPEPSLVPPLRFGHQLGNARSGTTSHGAVLGVELEQPLERMSGI